SPRARGRAGGRFPDRTGPRILIRVRAVVVRRDRPARRGFGRLVPPVPEDGWGLRHGREGIAEKRRRPAAGRTTGPAAGTAGAGATGLRCGRRCRRRGKATSRTSPAADSDPGPDRGEGILPGRGLPPLAGRRDGGRTSRPPA